MNDAERRVWARLPDGTRESLAGLSDSDLQTRLTYTVFDSPVLRERIADTLAPAALTA